MDFSKLFYGFVKIDTWIFLSCFIDLSKFIHGFVKVVLCISCPLTDKSKLKFDKDFKACWSFFFEQKVLNLNVLCPLCIMQYFLWLIRPEVKRGKSKILNFPDGPTINIISGMDVLRGMLCWYKKEIRQWMHGLHNTYNVIQSVQVISCRGELDYKVSNIVQSIMYKSCSKVIWKRLGSEYKEGSWAI